MGGLFGAGLVIVSFFIGGMLLCYKLGFFGPFDDEEQDSKDKAECPKCGHQFNHTKRN